MLFRYINFEIIAKTPGRAPILESLWQSIIRRFDTEKKKEEAAYEMLMMLGDLED